MLDRVVLHIGDLFNPIFFVSYRVLEIAFLPNRFVSAATAAVGLVSIGIILWIAVFGIIGFDVSYDFRISCALMRGDNHVEMIRHDDDSIDTVVKDIFARPETFTEQIDSVDENRIAPVGGDGDEVAVSICIDSSVVCHDVIVTGKSMQVKKNFKLSYNFGTDKYV